MLLLLLLLLLLFCDIFEAETLTATVDLLLFVTITATIIITIITVTVTITIMTAIMTTIMTTIIARGGHYEGDRRQARRCDREGAAQGQGHVDEGGAK